MRAGRLSLEAYQAHLIGVVGTSDDIEPVETALAAIDPAMTIDLQPIDPRPIASLDLKLSPADGIVLTGTLPDGLSEGEALLALGIRRYDGKLDEKGRGPHRKMASKFIRYRRTSPRLRRTRAIAWRRTAEGQGPN